MTVLVLINEFYHTSQRCSKKAAASELRCCTVTALTHRADFVDCQISKEKLNAELLYKHSN